MSSQKRPRAGCAFLVFLVIIGLLAAFSQMDTSGMIPHTQDSSITAQGNWFVGESKECYSYPLIASLATGQPYGYALNRVNCDDGPLHNVNIKFFGRVAQPEYAVVYWRCTREEDEFACYERYGLRHVP